MICDEHLFNMFWKYNSTSSPQFDAVLQKEGITLQELMDQDDVIQECKLQNKKLVDFLCQRNILAELVTLITEEPSTELDEKVRFKYPNIACELLTCDVPMLNESLSQDNELLEKLYSFLEKDPPLNPLLASFLSRTLGVLIVKKLDQNWISYQVTCLQAMGFLKDKQNFLELLLKHLGTSAIMDLTLKLITEVGDVEHRQNLLNWLDSKELIQSLVGLFAPEIDPDRHYNAAQLLCDVLRISRDALYDHRERMESDPILTRLESPETAALLLDKILGANKSESSIVSGIQVLLALLGHKNNFNDNNAYNNPVDDIEMERKRKIAESTALVIVNRLKDFHQILLDPPKKEPIKTTVGCLDPPLGNTRLQVVKLIAALISINHTDLLREMINLGIVEVLLDLFFQYVWNNFLHALVEQCISAAFQTHCKVEDSDENAMHNYLILKCRILNRILEAWENNEREQSKPKGVRQGYMGHLIRIANLVVSEIDKNSDLNSFIQENVSKDTLAAWDTFVKGALAETNKTQKIVLGGIHPNNISQDGSNDDYNIQATIFQQQIYADIQSNALQPDLIENYNFHDNEFNEPDDPIHSTLDRCANITLSVNEGELNRQQELFKKVCNEYISAFDEADDNIFDEQISSSHPAKDNTSTDNFQWDSRENNSSDEEDNEKINEAEAWFSLEGNKSQMSISNTENPWASANASNMESPQDTNWADFSSFQASFPEAKPQPDPKDKVDHSGDKNSTETIQTPAEIPTEAQEKPQIESQPQEEIIEKSATEEPKNIESPAKSQNLQSCDKKEESDTDDDEIFECASENLGAEGEEPSEPTNSTQSTEQEQDATECATESSNDATETV